jgi:hypothetical protein
VTAGFDLTESIAPKSDQLNAEDLLTGPRTFTVAEVKRGSAEQPVDIHLAEFPGRPFKPSKTVRRILVSAWGPDASTYAGRRMTLYRDPAVRFGGMDVGGIRVSHLSHIAKPMTLVLAVSKGKRAPYVVQAPRRRTRAEVRGRRRRSLPPAQRRARTDRLGITDGETMLATVGQVIDREIASAKDLTPAEAPPSSTGSSTRSRPTPSRRCRTVRHDRAPSPRPHPPHGLAALLW